ncbi:MAG: alpha/beta fold hydrolase [Myxococcales bacterium]|nr:alpha/beta fold hydrolase [Myxococcales bacterium]HQY60675.1 alpha/beta fold hydrolase [Polyangiaceae bacterium]
MKHLARLTIASTVSLSLIALAALSFGGCSSEVKPAPNPPGTCTPGATDCDAGGGGLTLKTPALPCADAPESVYGAPPADAAGRGDITRCSTETPLTKEALTAKLTEVGYKGKPATSGARVYRVQFKTERGDEKNTAAASSGIIYVPDTPRAEKLPVVVAARGSRGQAAACAASKFDKAAEYVNDDLYSLVYPLVGAGYAVVLPDLAGYSNYGAAGNPPSVYAGAADVGKSTLDSAKAMRKLFPVLDNKVVLVGHSQGGHSALSALALAPAYAPELPIAGVAVYAPLWLSQRSWGAALFSGVSKDYPIATVPSIAAVSVWYHYTHAELLDGPGEGKKLFPADKADKIKAFVDGQCWDAKYPQLEALGTLPNDLFDPEFVKTVALVAAGINDCDPANAACVKWAKRYAADRPRLTGAAAQTPMLLLYGAKDTTIPKDRMQCALDRLKQDQTKTTVCVEPDATHSSIVDVRSDYVADWIANVALGGPAPAACPSDEKALVDDKGAAVKCATPPPND